MMGKGELATKHLSLPMEARVEQVQLPSQLLTQLSLCNPVVPRIHTVDWGDQKLQSRQHRPEEEIGLGLGC